MNEEVRRRLYLSNHVTITRADCSAGDAQEKYAFTAETRYTIRRTCSQEETSTPSRITHLLAFHQVMTQHVSWHVCTQLRSMCHKAWVVKKNAKTPRPFGQRTTVTPGKSCYQLNQERRDMSEPTF